MEIFFPPILKDYLQFCFPSDCCSHLILAIIFPFYCQILQLKLEILFWNVTQSVALLNSERKEETVRFFPFTYVLNDILSDYKETEFIFWKKCYLEIILNKHALSNSL